MTTKWPNLYTIPAMAEDLKDCIKIEDDPKKQIDLITEYLKSLKKDKNIDSNLLKVIARLLSKKFDKYDWNTDLSPADIEYVNLTAFSKKKVVVRDFVNKFPSREDRQKILADLKLLSSNEELFESLEWLGIDLTIIELFRLFVRERDSSDLTDVISTYTKELDDDRQNAFLEILMAAKAPDSLLNNFDKLITDDDEEKVDFNISESGKYVQEKVAWLLEMSETDRKKVSDLNPFMLDLDFETGLKIFSFHRFREIYNKNFLQIANNIINREWVDWEQLFANDIYKINMKKLFRLSKSTQNVETKELQYAYQFIMDWDISNSNLTEEDIFNIAKMLDTEIDSIHLVKPIWKNRYDHPVKTSSERFVYKWYFSKSENKFLESNLVFLEEDRIWNDKKKVLRLTLADTNQDEYIYLITQISYYIKHKKFIDKHQLYFSIYDEYNKKTFEWDKLYDPHTFEEQYANILENLVIPLSVEAKDLGLKARSTSLVWIYWTGKSQHMLSLLKEKTFDYNWKNFNLNATVINIDLNLFKSILTTPIWWIKSRLDKIYENTGAPILLSIEDIDTLVNEKKHDVNDEIAQAMTIFFEWVWSTPVYVISTANDPTKLSERLIRANRLENTVYYWFPTIKEKLKIFQDHISERNLDFPTEFMDWITDEKYFVSWTASNIGNFVSRLSDFMKIRKEIFWEEVRLDMEIINKIYMDSYVPVADMKETDAKIRKWIENMKPSNLSSWVMWFNTSK